MKLEELIKLGFDESYRAPHTRRLCIKCSQCEALFINGTPSHETGCPNQMFECKGCYTLIPYRGYCSECL